MAHLLHQSKQKLKKWETDERGSKTTNPNVARVSSEHLFISDMHAIVKCMAHIA